MELKIRKPKFSATIKQDYFNINIHNPDQCDVNVYEGHVTIDMVDSGRHRSVTFFGDTVVEAFKAYRDEAIQRRLDDLQDTAFRLRGMLDNHPKDIDATAAYEDADAILKELESLNQLLDGGQE